MAPAATDETTEYGGVIGSSIFTEELITRATELTEDNFSGADGRRRMLLYAPIYLSSHCVNRCQYCGFNDLCQIERKHLGLDEALDESNILLQRGIRHQLLVGGDAPRLTTTEYYVEKIAALSRQGVSTAIEIAPQSVDSYAAMVAAGVRGVTLYQETYDERLYALYHPKGPKASYERRLDAMDRAARGGIGRLGFGVLLGLADPREDVSAMIAHAQRIVRLYPDRTLAFSLPRIHRAPRGFEAPYPVDDDIFLRLYCALRLAFPQAELVLSTRESRALRNRLAKICITQMSAGSSTAPGGYGQPSSDEQFPVTDHRSVAEVAGWLESEGFCVAWDILSNPD
ncbi:MAG: radical SAM protein, partial [Planctomycetota bacterium]|nr:radical SAM protein [Planctomycetota bacterium]